MSDLSLNCDNTVSVYCNGEEVAFFTMYVNPYSVLIEYEGIELAKTMIYTLCSKLKLPLETPIYLDESNGFWEAVGFKPNPYYDSTISKGGGYEMVIEFGKLLEWASIGVGQIRPDCT